MDSSYIKIAAATAVTTSSAFDLFGEGKIIAGGLVGDEYVKLLEETPSGTYVDAINDKGLGVTLTATQPSRIIVGYGSYKLYKSLTSTAVAVAAIS